MIRAVLIYLVIGLAFSVSRAITDANVKDEYRFVKGKRPAYGPLLGWMVLFACLWPVALCILVGPVIFQTEGHKAAKRERQAAQPFRVKHKHLVRPWTIEEIEAHAMVHDPLGGVPHKPFGHLNAMWVAFRNELPEGTGLWSFKAHWERSEWDATLLDGYVVSDGNTIGQHVTTKMRRVFN